MTAALSNNANLSLSLQFNQFIQLCDKLHIKVKSYIITLYHTAIQADSCCSSINPR